MEVKHLFVEMADGIYSIPASVIAKDRAEYYAQLDSETGGDYDVVYNEEYHNTIEDDYELVDWASNNMDWDDVVDEATKVDPTTPVDPNDYWPNANKKVMKG